ncbi:hypothetical protein C8R43DRAFT_888139 [Mycena crocata]|nr:hypothetical protein C8R43DRAFT_888139 [Mycena crocata]
MNDAFRPECCLPGTGREILDEVTGWLAVPSDSFGKILLLSGVAGSGKSSIAATISLAFLEIRRLGAFLFFNRNDPARSHPDLVIRRLAHLLARHNTHFETAIAAAIEGNPNVMTTPLQHQFKTLILGPALSVERHIRGPIFIVIDALDECGNPDSRAALLSVVAEDFPQLPDLFRFLITTRPEADIVDHQGCKLFPMKSLDPGTDSSLADVQLFIRHELARIGQQRKLAPAWPKKEHLHTLVNLAGGRFLWAAMAIRLIDAFRPNEQLQSLIAQKSTRELDIDALYTTALESVVYWSNRETAHEARAVLACVALAREPVLDLTIARLTRGGSAAKLVYSLRSVIQIHPRADARQVYPGVVEFLTNPSRSGGKHWAIDVRIEQQSLALGCLEILNSELQFNICGLEDSHILNTAIADSAHRIASRISPPLSYASRFWFNHLQEAAFDPEVVQAMDIFFREKFLYWLEVLSLMGQVAIVPTALTAADSYVKVDGDLKDFIGDARRFVATFKFVIMQSAPHIYLSALPFVPRESRVAQQFNPCFPKTLRVASSGIQWPSTEKSSLGHKDWVHSVCFSPDGRRIISGADDKIVCVWDAKTGDLVAGPCSGHTGDVNSVAYSPDGTRIASGATDCTIRIWDPSTGEALGKPFEGHEGEVNSVSFSPDGTRVVSGAADATIFMWDVATGEIVGESLEGHTGQVMSVSFSPDGTRIVSGAADGTVRLWDVATGKAVGKPIEDSTFAVTSVNYSSDGTRIVSACTNNTIRMFDAETGAMIGEPFEEDSYSVSFSPDGTRIACGSRSIFVLDAETGFRVAGPLDGHTSHIYCVNFAPDGMRIASASADQTVRVTDLSGFRLVPGQDLPAENAQKSSSLGKPLGDFPRLNSLTGWIHNASGELMFWVPYWLRDGLYFPHHTLVISIEPHTKLDLSAFVHGTEWTQCIDPEFRDRVRFIVDRAAQKVQS